MLAIHNDSCGLRWSDVDAWSLMCHGSRTLINRFSAPCRAIWDHAMERGLGQFGYCYGNSPWTNGLAGYAAFGTSMTS